ncbi:MAG: OmpH family outer membrane protein [Chitinophagales bacterium]
MKKTILILALLAFSFGSIQAQRFCIVDMEYILSKLPEYTNAQEQIDQLAQTWKEEIDLEFQKVEKAYTKFQAEQVLMTEQMKAQKISEIEAMEKKAKEMQKAKFGPDGELFKKRQSLIKPIQDKIYEKVQLYAKDKSYEAIFDKSSAGVSILFFEERLDKSDDILRSIAQ